MKKELSIKGLIMNELFLDRPNSKEREETAEKICQIVKEKILAMKFQHNHKTIDEEYKCGCGWSNDIIDDICGDLEYKKIFIKTQISTPKREDIKQLLK